MICRACADAGDIESGSWKPPMLTAELLHQMCEAPGDPDNKAQPPGCTCQHRSGRK